MQVLHRSMQYFESDFSAIFRHHDTIPRPRAAVRPPQFRHLAMAASKSAQPSSVTGAERLAPSPSSIASSCATLLDETHPLQHRCDTAYALCKTLDEFLPEPALLDAILPDLVRALSAGITEPALHSLAASAASYDPNVAVQPAALLVFRVLQIAHKVRGAKLVARHYPHARGVLCARVAPRALRGRAPVGAAVLARARRAVLLAGEPGAAAVPARLLLRPRPLQR